MRADGSKPGALRPGRRKIGFAQRHEVTKKRALAARPVSPVNGAASGLFLKKKPLSGGAAIFVASCLCAKQRRTPAKGKADEDAQRGSTIVPVFAPFPLPAPTPDVCPLPFASSPSTALQALGINFHRWWKSRDAHRCSAMPKGVSTSLDTNG